MERQLLQYWDQTRKNMPEAILKINIDIRGVLLDRNSHQPYTFI